MLQTQNESSAGVKMSPILSDGAGGMQEQVKDARCCCRQVVPAESSGQRRNECESGQTSAATTFFP